MTSESAHEPPFIILTGCYPATCQIVCPTPPPTKHSSRKEDSLLGPMIETFFFFFSCVCDVFISDKTVKLWKISERDKRPEGYNLKDEDGRIRDPSTITSLRVRGRRRLSRQAPPEMSHPCWYMDTYPADASVLGQFESPQRYVKIQETTNYKAKGKDPVLIISTK